MIEKFEFQPELSGELVRLRALTVGDFDALQSVASNLSTWADYPNKGVQQSGSLAAWFAMGVEAAKALLILDAKTNQIIGTTRYYLVPDEPAGVGIGYTFLDADSRNDGQSNAELKALMFEHAFATLQTVWFHVLPTNLRSQAAVKKLDVVEHGIQTLHLTDRPYDYATFSIDRASWAKRP